MRLELPANLGSDRRRNGGPNRLGRCSCGWRCIGQTGNKISRQSRTTLRLNSLLLFGLWLRNGFGYRRLCGFCLRFGLRWCLLRSGCRCRRRLRCNRDEGHLIGQRHFDGFDRKLGQVFRAQQVERQRRKKRRMRDNCDAKPRLFGAIHYSSWPVPPVVTRETRLSPARLSSPITRITLP